MPNDECCPHCGVSLQGEEIPEKHRHLYGDKTHFSRKIGVEVQGVYDGVLYYQCYNCGGKWHRFDPTHPLHQRAVKYVQED